MRFGIAVLLALVLASVQANAQSGPPVDVATRARGSAQVVVATVLSVQPRFGTNGSGDRLILSDVSLRTEEVLKGPFSPLLALTVEGGTIGDLTLDVSDLPAFSPGERGVFFLDVPAPGRVQLHGRDLGLLPLDAQGNIPGSTLTLADVRRAVRGAQ